MRSETPPGARRRTFTEDARRAQLVESTVDAIADLGYARASLAEIAKRAGVSKGVVSYHFAGKDELVEQVVATLYSRAGSLIGDQVEEAQTSATALRGYIEANLAFVRADPRSVRVLIEIFANHRDGEGRPHYDAAGNDGLLAHLEGLLRAGQRSGEFRPFATRPVAMVVRAAIDAGAGQLAADPEFDIDGYTEELLTMLDLATARTPTTPRSDERDVEPG